MEIVRFWLRQYLLPVAGKRLGAWRVWLAPQIHELGEELLAVLGRQAFEEFLGRFEDVNLQHA